MDPLDQEYASLLLAPMRTCKHFRPAFGKGRKKGSDQDGVTLAKFKRMYGADPLYRWIGLDSDLMYAAHKAAGAMTSIYRQLGIGCERVFRAVAMRGLGLSPEQVAWGYDVVGKDNEVSHLDLDARIDLDHIADAAKRREVADWLRASAESLGIDASRQGRGVVFEVRQGYKSADAKRQNADLRSALRARDDGYLFSLAILSTQVSHAVMRRYSSAHLLVLLGDLSGDTTRDTFAFCEQVMGYSLRGFFERNSESIRSEVEGILATLLSPE